MLGPDHVPLFIGEVCAGLLTGSRVLLDLPYTVGFNCGSERDAQLRGHLADVHPNGPRCSDTIFVSDMLKRSSDVESFWKGHIFGSDFAE